MRGRAPCSWRELRRWTRAPHAARPYDPYSITELLEPGDRAAPSRAHERKRWVCAQTRPWWGMNAAARLPRTRPAHGPPQPHKPFRPLPVWARRRTAASSVGQEKDGRFQCEPEGRPLPVRARRTAASSVSQEKDGRQVGRPAGRCTWTPALLLACPNPGPETPQERAHQPLDPGPLLQGWKTVRPSLPRFESRTCHHLRKWSVAWDFAGFVGRCARNEHLTVRAVRAPASMCDQDKRSRGICDRFAVMMLATGEPPERGRPYRSAHLAISTTWPDQPNEASQLAGGPSMAHPV